MSAADKATIFLTSVLAFATVIYALLAYLMMRSQKKVQQFGSRPVIGIEISKLTAVDLHPKLKAIFAMTIKLINLSSNPALRLQLDASLELSGKRIRLVGDLEDVPFIVGNQQKEIPCLIGIEYGSVLAVAQDAYAKKYELAIEGKGPIISSKQAVDYPICSIEVEFENHLGERGKCSAKLKLEAQKKVTGEWDGLKAVPVSARESLVCNWKSPKKGRLSSRC